MPQQAQQRTYTITAALLYANGPAHIGHLAGAYLPADIYARYLRSLGHRVLFVSGSDEHGVPITLRAQQEKIQPQQLVDKYHHLNKQALSDLGISFDIFAQTSAPLHHQTASAFFTTLYQKDILTVRETEQYYDPAHQQFLADRYISGTCPRCNYKAAYGDQCESCGATLSPEDLLNPRSALSGASPVRKKTKHWYLPLDRYERWLRTWVLEGHKNWKPNVYQQCKAWLDQGLQPRAVTRDLAWGVPVPLPQAISKVLYVWFDAPIGYISATQAWAATHGQDWEPFWKDPQTKLVHFIGKDNIFFHCMLFPAMLKAHGGFILPENVPANEFLNLAGEKVSTSRNHAVWLHEYLISYKGKQDVLRYVVCSNAPENKDSDFTWQDLQARNNNELVATLGNFVHRTLVLVHKYFQGVVPTRATLSSLDQTALAQMQQAPEQIGQAIEQYKFKEAIQRWMDLARLGNKYLADTAPWHLIKSDQEQVQTILNIALQLTANIAVLGMPFLPFTSQQLSKMLGITPPMWPRGANTDLLKPGQVVQQPTLLFERI